MTTLPEGFSPEFFILPERLNRIEETGALSIPEALPGMRGTDCNVYYPDDVPPNLTILGDHSSVYIEGKLGTNATIRVRQGIVSAHSLEPGSEAMCYSIIVVEDLQASLSSLTLRNGVPLVIQVPPGKRKEVFLELITNPRQSGEYDKRMSYLSDEEIDAMTDEEFKKHHDKAMGAFLGSETGDEAIQKSLQSLQERGLIVSTSHTARLARQKNDAREQRGH